jgi:hypothetical protein
MPFNGDDVIIASDDGKTIFKISQAQLLAQFKVDLSTHSDEYAPVIKLLKQGVQVAAMPSPTGGAHASGDMMCYLLNLAGLKTTTNWET